MPSHNTLEAFIACVEANRHVEAIEAYYAPEASMQENELPPRCGRDTLVAHERAVLTRTRSVRSTCVRPVFTAGDRVVIRWVFEFEGADGTSTRLDELAWQRWDGERIVEEKFFYDTQQLRPTRR
jgi:hypothetical protein